MAENQFQGHQKKKKNLKNQCQPGHGPVQEKGSFCFFFSSILVFLFAEGNEPAAPESLLLVKARS